MHYSEEEKSMWLEDWRQSGKSARAYAKENNLNPQTFVNWTKAESTAGFVEVCAAKATCASKAAAPILPPVHHSQEILIEKGDVKIHIPLCLGRGELRAVMEGLGAAL
jgi:hypothetical protein